MSFFTIFCVSGKKIQINVVSDPLFPFDWSLLHINPQKVYFVNYQVPIVCFVVLIFKIYSFRGLIDKNCRNFWISCFCLPLPLKWIFFYIRINFMFLIHKYSKRGRNLLWNRLKLNFLITYSKKKKISWKIPNFANFLAVACR